jgi:predicted ester cyclase
MFRSAFPDVRATIDDLIAEGDKVVVRSTWHGSHKGDFFGIPPTGKDFTLTAIDIVRVVDGKVVEHWGNEDDLGMLAQLGIVTPPA